MRAPLLPCYLFPYILVSMSTFPSLAIVGLGLMGGSLALALKEKNRAQKIIGITRKRATLDAALQRGAIDAASDELNAARDADIIVLAAPVRTILTHIHNLKEIARDGALILDMGSTKRAIVNAMNQLPERLRAVGGHPMCGKESAGFDAADASLYQDKIFVLTPTERTNECALNTSHALAETIGSRVIEMDAARHDEIVAAVSHLPYILASNLVATVDDFADGDEMVWQIASSGYRDTSRLAASDVTMMLDILLTNSENVANMMRAYSRRFGELADLIYDEDEKTLREMLERAARVRREIKI
ncbi:MAG: prephenate dehydrogenase [Chloroflexota bacterium]|nr:MAG: prephenate dehydrogenase [Chloroflexota bacterium]